MSYYFLWMVVEIALLVGNYFVIKKYKSDIVYQGWFEVYFWIHKIMTFLPGVILAWAGYIYLYDFFNSYQFYRIVYMKELQLLTGYFVVGLLLFYLGDNARKLYAFARCALVGLNVVQAFFIFSKRSLVYNFNDPRNIFFGGDTKGIIILVLWLIIDLLNILSFIQYYKANRYEMTD